MLNHALHLAALGFSIIPIHHPATPVDSAAKADSAGKRPLLRSWERFQRAAAPSELLGSAEWFGTNEPRNLGVVCGVVSAVVVVDADSADAEEWVAANLPATPWVVRTGKGRHLYYRHPGGDARIRNRAKIKTTDGQKAIDVRGDGGYVVGAFSTHASGAIYEPANWPWAADDVVPTFDPAWLTPAAAAPSAAPTNEHHHQPPGASAPANGNGHHAGNGNGRAPSRRSRANGRANGHPDPLAGLSIETREFLEVGAPDGERNDRLFRAACDLAGNHWALTDAMRALLRAACDRSGLPRGEAEATIRSAFAEPRVPARPALPPPASTWAAESSADEDGRPIVLVPGEHMIAGKRCEISTYDFMRQFLEHMPEDAFYSRAGAAGTLVKGKDGRSRFAECSLSRTRMIVDKHLRLIHRVWSERNQREEFVYRPCNEDNGKLLRDAAGSSRKFRVLAGITVAPVFVRSANGELTPLATGYNRASGWYRDESAGEIPTEPLSLDDQAAQDAVFEAMRTLLVDFPFMDASDAENVVALLLTLILRPAIRGNVPMWLAEASIERTGKTKLLSELVGGIIFGRAIETTAFPKTDEELDKRVLSWLTEGREVILFDNVHIRSRLDSPVLAQLVTSEAYNGRLLGTNRTVSLPHYATVLLTGNNPSMEGELAKRTIPVRLQPDTDRPELRSDFTHDDLPAYIAAVRPRILSLLHGMILGWQAAGTPMRDAVRLGGFEDWAATVGGILRAWGFSEAFSNRDKWLGRSAPADADVGVFVGEWWSRWRETPVTIQDLLGLMRELGAWSDRLARTKSERGEQTVAGSILRELDGRPVSTTENNAAILVSPVSVGRFRRGGKFCSGFVLKPKKGTE